MKRQRKQREKRLHLPPLLIGAYLIFMGIAEVIMSRWTTPAGTGRCLLGAVCACLGLWGLWDGCRDLLIPRKKHDLPVTSATALPRTTPSRRSQQAVRSSSSNE